MDEVSTTGREQAPAPARAWPLLGALALLVATTLLDNLAVPGLYLLWAGLAAGGLVLLARADGLDRRRWGLGPVSRRAARAALALAAVTAAAMLIGTQLPGISSAFADARVAGMTAGEVAFAALVRAPLGTAVFEELAFRGVLLAMLVRRVGSIWAVVGSSLAFGLWHVLPSLGIVRGNAGVVAVLGGQPTWAASSVAVVAAGVAGAFLCLLRNRFDHLVVPIAVHLTATSMGYLLAWSMATS